MKKAFIRAFPVTIPVLLGYVPLGIAFGLMLQHAGYGVHWAVLSSATIYSGTGQFIEVSFLRAATPILEVAVLVLILNSRMMFYGLSFLNRFSGMGWRKWYMIFALTDETYAILCAVRPPRDVDEQDFMFALSFLNQLYWIAGGIIGVAAGRLISLDTTGIDFIMTALFVVLAMDQWKAYACHEPVFIGLVSAVVSLLLFGPENFMIPALLSVLLLLILRRRKIQEKSSRIAGMENGDAEKERNGK